MRPVRLIVLSLVVFGVVGCGAVPRVVFLNDPLSSDEHLRLGLSYEAQGKWDLALSEYKAALGKGGASAVIEGYLGNVYFSKKEYTSAEEAYRKSLSKNPENAPILNNLAFLYVTRKESLKEAERLVRRAIEIDPPQKAYYLDTLGSIYLERGEADLAFSVYREAEALPAGDPSLLDQLSLNRTRALHLLEGTPLPLEGSLRPSTQGKNRQGEKDVP